MSPDIVHKIEAFFAKFDQRHLDKGEMLVFADEDPQYVFYLLKGQVRVYDISNHGNEVVLNIFKPPAFFPLSWAINRTPNKYFYEAATAVELRQAPPKPVITFLQENPDVLFDLLSRLYRGTDGLLARMAHLMGGSARSRLIFELLLEVKRFGVPRKNGENFIAINESELGTLTGLSRETVNREMRKLMAAELVIADRHGITLKSLDRLEKELGTSL